MGNVEPNVIIEEYLDTRTGGRGYKVLRPSRIKMDGEVSHISTYRNMIKIVSGHAVLCEYKHNGELDLFSVQKEYAAARKTLLDRAKEIASEELRELGLPGIEEVGEPYTGGKLSIFIGRMVHEEFNNVRYWVTRPSHINKRGDVSNKRIYLAKAQKEKDGIFMLSGEFADINGIRGRANPFLGESRVSTLDSAVAALLEGSREVAREELQRWETPRIVLS